MTFTAFPPDFCHLSAADSSRLFPGSGIPFAAPFGLDSSTPSNQPNPAGEQALSVLGEPWRSGSCRPSTVGAVDGTLPHRTCSDLGQHTVCCVGTENFLSYSRSQGNDLSTPMPGPYGFPWLKPGDHLVRSAAARWWSPIKMASLHRCAWKHRTVGPAGSFPLELLRQNGREDVRARLGGLAMALCSQEFSAHVPNQESPAHARSLHLQARPGQPGWRPFRLTPFGPVRSPETRRRAAFPWCRD